MMLRIGLTFCAAVLLCAGIGVAQDDAVDIVVGGEVVARVREKGPYESVQHRAAAIDDAINQVLATTDDPASLEVSLEKIDGLWTVLIADQQVMSVYPAEAEANGLLPEVVGALWVRKLKDALPHAAAVEVQEIGAPVATPVPAVRPAPAPAPSTSDEPATGAVTNVGTPTVEVLEVPGEDTAMPEIVVAGQGARLRILEAFNEARDLPEDEYLLRREVMAEELFDELAQILTGGRVHGRLSAAETGVAALPTPLTPPSTATTAVAPPPIAMVTGAGVEPGGAAAPPTVSAAPSSYPLSAAGRAQIEAAIPAGDPSYANVVQKVVIKAKFRAASDAYAQAVAADPGTAAQAKEVLTGARRASTAGEWDQAESYLDTAFRLLGVTQWEQHIGAAMKDLGLGG
ncbi:MAG: hypothetical protein AB7Y46_03085 [Armatimonadota bacterium]